MRHAELLQHLSLSAALLAGGFHSISVRADIAPNSLRLTRTSTQVHLAWSPASPAYDLYRSSSPAGLTRRSNLISSTSALFYDDPLSGLPGSIYFFAAGDPARCLDAEACNGEDDTCDGQIDEGLGNFTCGIGACQRTVAACVSGTPQICMPGAAVTELCDGIDNNCDGRIDEGCGCTYAAPFGSDVSGTGSASQPFRTIQFAISRAGSGGLPRVVCVGGSVGCATSALNTNYAESVLMANGTSVYGGYSPVGAIWSRSATCITTISSPAAAATGVTFPNTVQSPTLLDGFTVNAAGSNATAAAVTVDGATGVQLSNLVVNGAGTTNSYGINLINGGVATITKSNIFGGSGSAEAIGVRSIGSRPTITGNCSSFDASGRCAAPCVGLTNTGIRGRATGGPGVPSVSDAVLLSNSPNAVVDSSALCNVIAVTGRALEVTGNGAGIVIHGNSIEGNGGTTNAYGVRLADCGGAAPWVVDNSYIAGQSSVANSKADGVHAVGDCHPVIDRNMRIVGGVESAQPVTNGVFCGANVSGTASRCAVIGNTAIQGSGTGFPPTSTGVRCDGGSCWRIVKNTSITGQGGVLTFGLQLNTSGPLVDNNGITGGCGSSVSTGVQTQDAWSRIQNNRITSGICTTGGPTPTTYGIRAIANAGTVEIDVHSNDIDGGRNSSGFCSSAGLALDVGPSPPSGGVGIYRNNIIRAGQCAPRYNVRENSTSADPRIFQNNNLDPLPTAFPTALYLDENANPQTTAGAVNGLGDMTVGGVISADSLYVTYPTDLHLQTGSTCINAGTPSGAPAKDMDGQQRDATPDIGADEH